MLWEQIIHNVKSDSIKRMADKRFTKLSVSGSRSRL